MAISRKEIEHIAVLARLDSNGGIFDRLAEDMQGIVGMVDKLQQLDLGDITDQIDTERVNALREDVAIAVLHPIRTIVSACCSSDIDWVERSDGQMVSDVAIAAIRAAGYDIVPRK